MPDQGSPSRVARFDAMAEREQGTQVWRVTAAGVRHRRWPRCCREAEQQGPVSRGRAGCAAVMMNAGALVTGLVRRELLSEDGG